MAGGGVTMGEMRTCGICGEPVAAQLGFDMSGVLYCPKCFTTKASEHRSLSKEDRNRLRREVKQEMDAILPREVLRDLIEDG